MPQKQLQLMWAKWLLLLNLASALFMTGLIWFVQVVHYPLFERIRSLRWSMSFRHLASVGLWAS